MKFNANIGAKTLKNNPKRTTNLAGGVAYELDAKTELYQRVSTCLVNEPKYYEDKNTTVDAITELVKEVCTTDPEFVLKLAAYTRSKLLLRSVPILLLGEAVCDARTRSFVRKWTPKILQRADELSEIVAYLQSKLGDLGDRKKTGMLPNSIRKGIADTFGKFNEYQLQKYEQTGADKVKLKDVLMLAHPKPSSEEQSALWKRLLEGKLEIAETWETLISSKGSTKENWEEAALFMPIMALLRNLRNLLDKDVNTTVLTKVQAKLKNKEIILKSKQFPFRFLSAYRAIEDNDNMFTKHIMAALEDAMDISCENLPKLPGTTAIFADISGSMDFSISEKSNVTAKDVSCMMLAIADKISELSGTAVFSDNVWPINLNPRNGVLTNTKQALSAGNSSGTYTHLCFDRLKTNVDRALIFTDQQDYGQDNWRGSGELAISILNYRRHFNPNCFVYLIDLRGYGTTSVPQDDPKTCLIAGWSERILEYIKMFEEDKKTALDVIDRFGES